MRQVDITELPVQRSNKIQEKIKESRNDSQKGIYWL
jgi:hypothetical protein